MLPALMAAKPLVKYGVMIGAPIVLASLIFGWGYLKGRDDMKEKWDASIAQQADRSLQHVVTQADSTQDQLEQHSAHQREVYERIKIVERKVYVKPETPCPLDAPTVEQFDAISRLLPSPERVPTADPGAGEPVDAPEAGVTTFEALQAYYRAVEQLTWLWLDYEALVTWERERYRLEKAEFDHE